MELREAFEAPIAVSGAREPFAHLYTYHILTKVESHGWHSIAGARSAQGSDTLLAMQESRRIGYIAMRFQDRCRVDSLRRRSTNVFMP